MKIYKLRACCNEKEEVAEMQLPLFCGEGDF